MPVNKKEKSEAQHLGDDIKKVLDRIYGRVSLEISPASHGDVVKIKKKKGDGYTFHIDEERLSKASYDEVLAMCVSKIEMVNFQAKLSLDPSASDDIAAYEAGVKESAGVKFFYQVMFRNIAMKLAGVRMPILYEHLQNIARNSILRLGVDKNNLPLHMQFLMGLMGELDNLDDEVREAIADIDSNGLLGRAYHIDTPEVERLRIINQDILPIYKFFLKKDFAEWNKKSDDEQIIDDTKKKVEKVENGEKSVDGKKPHPDAQEKPEQKKKGEMKKDDEEKPEKEKVPVEPEQQKKPDEAKGDDETDQQSESNTPDYNSNYGTPPEDSHLETVKQKDGFKIEIEPGLKGYYVEDRKSYFNKSNLDWDHNPKFTAYTASPQFTGKKYTLKSVFKGAGVKAIPLPNSYALDVDSLVVNEGQKPKILRDQNGNFFFQTDGKCDFSIDFYKEASPAVIGPSSADGEQIYQGKLSAKAEDAMYRAAKAFTEEERVKILREFIRANHYYPSGKNMQERLKSAAQTQIDLKNNSTFNDYVQNLDAAKHLECFSANTLFLAMLRKIGLKARLAIGYLAQELNDQNNTELTLDKKHGWVEVFLDGKWVRFDATPPKDPKEKEDKEKDKKKPEEQKKQSKADKAEDGGEDTPSDDNEEGEEDGDPQGDGKSGDGKDGEQDGDSGQTDGDKEQQDKGDSGEGQRDSEKEKGDKAGDDGEDSPSDGAEVEDKNDEGEEEGSEDGEESGDSEQDGDEEGEGESEDSEDGDDTGEQKGGQQKKKKQGEVGGKGKPRKADMGSNYDPRADFERMYDELQDGLIDGDKQHVGNDLDQAIRDMRHELEEAAQVEELDQLKETIRQQMPGLSEEELDSIKDYVEYFLKETKKMAEIPNPNAANEPDAPKLIDALRAILDRVISRISLPRRIPRYPVIDGEYLYDPVGLHLGRMGGEKNPAVWMTDEASEKEELKVVKVRRRKILDASDSMRDGWGRNGPKIKVQQLIEVLENMVVAQKQRELDALSSELDRDLRLETETWQFGVMDSKNRQGFRRLKVLSPEFNELEQAMTWAMAGELGPFGTNDYDPLESILKDLQEEEAQSKKQLPGKVTPLERIRAGFSIRSLKDLERLSSKIENELTPEEKIYLANLNANKEFFQTQLQDLQARYGNAIEPMIEVIEVSTDGGSANPGRVQEVITKLRSLGVIVVAYGLGEDGRAVEETYFNEFNPAEGGHYCKNFLDYPRQKKQAWESVLDNI